MKCPSRNGQFAHDLCCAQNSILGITTIYLRYYFSRALISNKFSYFWTDTKPVSTDSLYPKETESMNHTPIDEALHTIGQEIDAMKTAIERLESLRTGYPALERNLVRIRASIKMLEMNFVDPAKME